jgi:hypothetical protein
LRTGNDGKQVAVVSFNIILQHFYDWTEEHNEKILRITGLWDENRNPDMPKE